MTVGQQSSSEQGADVTSTAGNENVRLKTSSEIELGTAQASRSRPRLTELAGVRAKNLYVKFAE
jgi:hypothetical protein